MSTTKRGRAEAAICRKTLATSFPSGAPKGVSSSVRGVSVRPIGSGVSLAEVALDDAEAARPTLAPDEQALYLALATPSRKREWLGGRIAARAALAAQGGQALSVLRDGRGAPCLVGPGAQRFSVAISHGRRHAAAIACLTSGARPYAGVDLMDAEDRPRLGRVASRVFRPEEEAMAGAVPEIRMVAWGLREAVAKATGTGMFVFALQHVWLKDVNPFTRRCVTNLSGVDAYYQPLPGGGMLVWALVSRDTRAAAQKRAFGAQGPGG